MDLNGKCVLLGVSGGIAAYKMANVASALRKLGADVEVIMTQNATQFITPLTFETLTGHKCMVDTFDRDFKFEVTHISLAKKADVILVAPATANVIAKMAHGIADDMLTTVVLAAKCPKLVAPAMNTGMLENPITQDNLATLERYGFTVIPSESGVLACKDVGSGRLPKEEVLLERMKKRAEIEGRSDDTPEAIAKRLDVYAKETAPLLDIYQKRGLLKTFNGVGAVDEIQATIVAELG